MSLSMRVICARGASADGAGEDAGREGGCGSGRGTGRARGSPAAHCAPFSSSRRREVASRRGRCCSGASVTRARSGCGRSRWPSSTPAPSRCPRPAPAAHAVVLRPLAAPIVDLGAHDHEVVLADGRDHARVDGVGVLGARLEAPRRVSACRPAPVQLRVLVDQRVGVVLERAAADVLVGEVAADEALLPLGAGDAADAAERRQIEEALVVAAGALPDQEAGAGDVVGVGEPHQHAIAGGAAGRAAPRTLERPLTRRGPGDRTGAWASSSARVPAGVALVDLARDPVSGAPARQRSPYEEAPPSRGAEAPRATGRRKEGGIPNEASGSCKTRRTMTRRALNFIEEHNPTTLMVICAAGPRA